MKKTTFLTIPNNESLFFVTIIHSEHHELAKQIQDTDDTKMREDLERELDELVTRMEAKGEQIARLKRHKIQVCAIEREDLVMYHPSHHPIGPIDRLQTSESFSCLFSMVVSTDKEIILSQWAWFSMSTKNVIGSGQNFTYPLLGGDG